MLAKMNRVLERCMPLLTPIGVSIGVMLGNYLVPFIFLSPWLFAWMTFAGSLQASYREFFKVLIRPYPVILTLVILHIIMPLIAWSIGHLLYEEQPFTVTGLILAMVIPTGISSLMWVAMARGHIAITLSILLLDTILSPVIVPWTVRLLVGEQIGIDVSQMMIGLLFMIVLPSVLGMSVNEWKEGKIARNWAPRLAPFSKIMMMLVVMLNASAVAPYLRNFSLQLLGLALCAFALMSIGYVLGWSMSRAMNWNSEVTIAVTLNSGMRNISAGSVIAITYFPPLVAVPIFCCILFQQSLASLCSKLLQKYPSLLH